MEHYLSPEYLACPCPLFCVHVPSAVFLSYIREEIVEKQKVLFFYQQEQVKVFFTFYFHFFNYRQSQIQQRTLFLPGSICGDYTTAINTIQKQVKQAGVVFTLTTITRKYLQQLLCLAVCLSALMTYKIALRCFSHISWVFYIDFNQFCWKKINTEIGSPLGLLVFTE